MHTTHFLNPRIVCGLAFAFLGCWAVHNSLSPSTPEPASPTWLEREELRSQELERHSEEVFGPIKTKMRIAAKVVAGRLTLREAAEQFLALQELKRGKHPLLAELAEPEGSRHERACREVISFVTCLLRDQPETAAVVERLEEELLACGEQ